MSLKAEQSASVKAVCGGCLYLTTTPSQEGTVYTQATVVTCEE